MNTDQLSVCRLGNFTNPEHLRSILVQLHSQCEILSVIRYRDQLPSYVSIAIDKTSTA